MRVTAEDVWQALSVMSVQNPMSNGATGNGVANDLTALQATITALPAGGGLVYFDPTHSYLKTNFWDVSKSNVLLWAPNAGQLESGGRAPTIIGNTGNVAGTQAIRFNAKNGCGVYGLLVKSNASSRMSSYEDMFLSFIGGSNAEVVGSEVSGSQSAGHNYSGVAGVYTEGNYVHHTYSDHIYRATTTALATQNAYAWDNFTDNNGVSLGDDGISCVSYAVDGVTNDAFETWLNTCMNGNARGISVVGGTNQNVHDNWIINTGAAGLIFASESSFNSQTVTNVTYANNKVRDCARVITSHPGIFVSAGNPGTTLSAIAGAGNYSFSATAAQAYRTEAVGGTLGAGITSTGLVSISGGWPTPQPVAADARVRATTILRTRNNTFAAVGNRPGLYRIHVRRTPGSNPVSPTFQQRFEYVVQGSPPNMDVYIATRLTAGDYLSYRADTGGVAYAVFLTRAERTLGTGITAFTFAQMRAADNAGTLSTLWNRVDQGAY